MMFDNGVIDDVAVNVITVAEFSDNVVCDVANVIEGIVACTIAAGLPLPPPQPIRSKESTTTRQVFLYSINRFMNVMHKRIIVMLMNLKMSVRMNSKKIKMMAVLPMKYTFN